MSSPTNLAASTLPKMDTLAAPSPGHFASVTNGKYGLTSKKMLQRNIESIKIDIIGESPRPTMKALSAFSSGHFASVTNGKHSAWCLHVL